MKLPSQRSFRAGLVQLRSGRSVAPNMEMAEALIRRAAEGGAVYVQTPENTAIMELETERLLSELEVEEKAAPLKRLQALAKELGIWLHIGSLGMKLSSGKVANRSYLIAPDGEARRALRQAAYVRCRSCRRRKLPRVPAPSIPAPRPCSPICPGGASA